jgi:NAD+-dependent secondary alcohol dehydrogenase Adh1
MSAYERPLELVDLPDPEPRRADEVLLRIGGAGVCATDLHAIDGLVGAAGVTVPRVLGHENAGWVQEVGDGVSTVAPGDAVIVFPPHSCGLCLPCRRGLDMHCERHQFTGLTAVVIGIGGVGHIAAARARAGLEPGDRGRHRRAPPAPRAGARRRRGGRRSSRGARDHRRPRR